MMDKNIALIIGQKAYTDMTTPGTDRETLRKVCKALYGHILKLEEENKELKGRLDEIRDLIQEATDSVHV